MYTVVVLDHILFWNKTIFKIPTNVDVDATDDGTFINYNEQEPGGIKKNLM